MMLCVKKLTINILLCGTLTAAQLYLADSGSIPAEISSAAQNFTAIAFNSSKNEKAEAVIAREFPRLTELRKTVQYDKNAKCYLTNDARVVLKTAIAKTPAGESLPDDAWEGIYFRLWTYANIFGVESTYKDFSDVIDIMKEAGKLYDPKLQLPCTEYGFFKDHQAKVVHPLLPTQTVIIFGGYRNQKLHAEYGENVAYTVNIDDGTFYGGFWGKLEPDMFADMNNSVHLQLLPSESFDKVIIECVPVIYYFSPVFFQNANRLLKIGGILESITLYGLSVQPYKTQENGKLIRNNLYGVYYLSRKQIIAYLARFGFEPCDYDPKKIKKNQQMLTIDDKTHYYDYWYAIHHIYKKQLGDNYDDDILNNSANLLPQFRKVRSI